MEKVLNKNVLATEGRFFLFLSLMLGIVLAYWPTVKGIVSEWVSGSQYSHGWFSLLLFLHYLWQTRQSAVNEARGYFVCVTFLVLSSGMWWIGSIASIGLLQHIAIYCLLLTSIWLCWGWAKLLEIKYMLLVVALAMPVWQVLQLPLRNLSTEVTYFVIKAINIPVFIDGYRIQVPGGSFFVEAACAGLSFLLAGTTLSFVFAAWQKLKLKSVLVLFLISSFVAIAANWIRIVVIIVVGNITNMDSIIVHDHLTFGWVLFALIYCPVFWLLVRYYSKPIADGDTVVDEPVSSVPVSKYQLVLGIVFIGLLPVVHACVSNGYGQASKGIFEGSDVGGLQYDPVPGYADWKPHFEGAANESMRMVNIDGIKALVYVVEYPFQTQESELINVNNTFYDPESWRISETIPGDKNDVLKVSKGGSNSLIAYTYVIAGKQVVTWRESKLLQVAGYFTGQPEAYGVAVSLDFLALAQIEKPEKTAEKILNDVVRNLGLVKP